MAEHWLPVVGYEGCYEVSDLGRVKSIQRWVSNGKGFRLIKEKEIAQSLAKNGYLQISLWKNNEGKTHDTHIVVARAFLGAPPIGHEVAHLDGIRTNAQLSNLAYKTHIANIEQMKEHGTYRCGAIHPSAKLTDQDVQDIHTLWNLGVNQYALAGEFKVSQSHISGIVTGKERVYVTY